MCYVTNLSDFQMDLFQLVEEKTAEFFRIGIFLCLLSIEDTSILLLTFRRGKAHKYMLISQGVVKRRLNKKDAQKTHKDAQDTPKTLYRRLIETQKDAPRCLKDAQRRPKDAQRCPTDASKSFHRDAQVFIETHKDAPRRYKDAPKTPKFS